MRKLRVLTAGAAAQPPVNIAIRAGRPGPAMSPSLYGLMTEEINHSYDGGLYAELIRNRNFKEDPTSPVHWTAAKASIALDSATPCNEAVPASLKVTAGDRAPATVQNDGFWGIPVHPNTKYKATIYAKAAPGFTGPLTVAIASNDTTTIAAIARIPRLTAGMGLLEFLNWCEDLHMKPLLAVYAGYSLKGERVKPGPDLQPYVQDALDEIEYGGPATPWGARRAKDGHPQPFPLEYVEAGNEDDALNAKYPHLKVISTAGSAKARTADLIDEHLYPNSLDDMGSRAHQFDTRPRRGPQQVFVGEWATRAGAPTPNMAGSPAYYAQQMFSTHHGDTIVEIDAPGVPTHDWQPPTPRGRTEAPPVRKVPNLCSATRDSRTGTIYLKIVNPMKEAMPVHVTIPGVTVTARGQSTALTASSPDDTNSITEPTKIVPQTTLEDGLSTDFTKRKGRRTPRRTTEEPTRPAAIRRPQLARVPQTTFPPYSITILEMKATNAR